MLPGVSAPEITVQIGVGRAVAGQTEASLPQRDQDGRYEPLSRTAVPCTALEVEPANQQVQPDRKPVQRPGIQPVSIYLRVVEVKRHDAAAVEPAVLQGKPADDAKNAQPGPEKGPTQGEAVGAQQARAPLAPSPRAEEIKRPPAEFDLDRRPIGSVTTNIRCRPGDLPGDTAKAALSAMRDRPYNALADRNWEGVCYFWDAPALRHQPLYFEEVNLERYGYRWPGMGVFQPALSGAQFFATLPLLPYKVYCEPPREIDYTLGEYRPGSPVPYQVQLPHWRPGAGAAEAGTVAGLILLIP